MCRNYPKVGKGTYVGQDQVNVGIVFTTKVDSSLLIYEGRCTAFVYSIDIYVGSNYILNIGYRFGPIRLCSETQRKKLWTIKQFLVV